MLTGFRGDATARDDAGSWERPIPIAGEIVLSMLASMCSFGMVVPFVKFCVSVGGEGLYSYNRVTFTKIQVKIKNLNVTTNYTIFFTKKQEMSIPHLRLLSFPFFGTFSGKAIQTIGTYHRRETEPCL